MCDKNNLCPDCGHPVSTHTYDGCGYEPAVFCKCLRTKNQAMQEKDYCTSEWREYNCLDKSTCPKLSDGSVCLHYQPKKHCEHIWERHCKDNDCDDISCVLCHEEYFEAPADLKPAEPSEMPLVKNLITYPPDIAEALEVGKIRQQRAAMAWHKEQCKECIGFPCPMEAHDSAVASKARREFAEKVIAYTNSEDGQGISRKDFDAHIRAMAEGK